MKIKQKDFAYSTSTGEEYGKCGVCGFWHTYNAGIRKGCF